MPYLCTLGTLVVFLGCNQKSDTGAGGTADTTTRSSSSGSSSSVDTQNRTRSSDASAGAASRDTSTSPDNTGKNARDRSGDTLTSGDQKENQQDLEITRQIRREITSNDQLSQEAKNIKVMTVNGKVTLRGPVNSEQERKTIESIVQRMQGVTVDDQLEVKGTTQ